MNILIFGPNGSGKGTQGNLIKQKYNLAHIESGAIFREHIGGGTELGKKAKAYIDRGDLVPDDITIPMVLETLKTKGKDGWCWTGFPAIWSRPRSSGKPCGKKASSSTTWWKFCCRAKWRKTGSWAAASARKTTITPTISSLTPSSPTATNAASAGPNFPRAATTRTRTPSTSATTFITIPPTAPWPPAYFFKKLADEGKTKYIELNGEGSIDSIKETLLSKLS